jgi:alpha-ketoglutarate-dependent taurine dioxygenase
MLKQIVAGACAWEADTIDDRSAWYHPVPAEPSSWPVVPVRHALEQGRGFVILEAPAQSLTDAERTSLYWRIGEALGQPAAQNVQGVMLYDVRDTGQDVYSGARFSVTNAESGFHTDNSFGAEIVDWVGLLCLKTARAGGVNQLVSGAAVHNRMLTSFPRALEVLYRPFHIDRRGGVRPGEGPTVSFPVVLAQGQDLTWRYLRFWIEAGHEKAGEPLTAQQRDALGALEEVLRDPALRVEFALRPGEVLLVNNRWILHNRTAFEDHPELERRRHYVRLWLRRAS